LLPEGGIGLGGGGITHLNGKGTMAISGYWEMNIGACKRIETEIIAGG
jgi:hypothetical protein